MVINMSAYILRYVVYSTHFAEQDGRFRSE